MVRGCQAFYSVGAILVIARIGVKTGFARLFVEREIGV